MREHVHNCDIVFGLQVHKKYLWVSHHTIVACKSTKVSQVFRGYTDSDCLTKPSTDVAEKDKFQVVIKNNETVLHYCVRSTGVLAICMKTLVDSVGEQMEESIPTEMSRKKGPVPTLVKIPNGKLIPCSGFFTSTIYLKYWN